MMENAERILIVNTTMDRGGAETLIMNLYRSLDRNRLQFDFVLHCDYKSAYEDEIQSLGGKIYKLPPYRFFNESSFRKSFAEFFQNHPEYRIIHGHNINSASVYLDVANKFGLKTISHCHCSSNGSGPAAWIRDFKKRHLSEIAQYRFACSNEAGIWAYGKGSSFKVIKNGIITQRFLWDETKRKETRKALGIDENAIVLGNVGRLQKEKNQAFAIKVFKAFQSKCPNSKLVITGTGPLEKELKSLSQSMGLENSVIFTGVRSDVDSILCAMDVFLFPSIFEGLPLTLIEAQCTGLPCVVSDIITDEVDIANLIRKVPLSSSAEDWADIIEESLKIPRKAKDETVKESGFDIAQTASEMEQFYEGLLNDQ